MVTFLIILAVLVVIIALILSLSATFTIDYDEKWSTKIKVLWIEKEIKLTEILNFVLFPDKKAEQVKENKETPKAEKEDTKSEETNKEVSEEAKTIEKTVEPPKEEKKEEPKVSKTEKLLFELLEKKPSPFPTMTWKLKIEDGAEIFTLYSGLADNENINEISVSQSANNDPFSLILANVADEDKAQDVAQKIVNGLKNRKYKDNITCDDVDYIIVDDYVFVAMLSSKNNSKFSAKSYVDEFSNMVTKKETNAKSEKPKAQAKPNFLQKLWDDEGLLGILGLLSNVMQTASKAVGTLIRGFHIRSLYVKIIVAGSDAAQTAKKFGKVSSFYYPTIGIILNGMRVDEFSDDIYPDYLAKYTEYGLHFVGSINIYLLVKVVFAAAKTFIVNIIKNK